LVAPLSGELKKHHEQVDEIKIKHQSSDNRFFVVMSAGSTARYTCLMRCVS
jgi:hypothetical protein